ncbi:acyltransferase family protein [Streptomyces sp. NPDC088745]|uniref:acyltransferase family protein n=1 Tax=Streptomyces sp. NPDC088745 TaxID=3365884 RepID=UPI003804C24C
MLDGLRLVAALMVVGYHFVGYDRWTAPPWPESTSVVFPVAHQVGGYGWLGVQFFFLISGFVICMSCWGRTVRQFAVSRIVRLYPAYWFAVLAVATLMLLVHGSEQTGITASKILTNLTMFQGGMGVGNVTPVAWTLWVEMRFYLLFAVVCALGVTYRRCVVFCALWLLAAMVAPQSDSPLVEMAVMAEAAPFFVGGMVVFLMRRFGTSAVLWLLLGGSWLVAQHQLQGLVEGAEGAVGGKLSWEIALGLVTVFYGLLLAVALLPLRAVNRPWLVTAGALTYPLYLLHEDFGWEAIRWLHPSMPPWAVIGVTLAGLFVVSYAVHRLVERPGGKALRKWLGPKPEGGRAKAV